MKLHPAAVDRMCASAEPYYNPAQPYHNWGHAEEVMHDSLMVLNSGGRWTRHVNRGLLQIAAAWHDAGHDHPEAAQFESKEHYAVKLATQALRQELSSRHRAEMSDMILGTRFAAPRNTMAAIALHYGDVYNMGLSYDVFSDHTTKLWQEYGAPPWSEFWSQAQTIITRTVIEADSELPRIGVTNGDWQFQVQQNLFRMSREKGNE
ncbi:MAG TPA: hypothetical protein PKV96_00840 [Candidatus Saccharimonas sp.]|jgi:hypothetical protein|nr:hypothetical protein [Candidatus Saccharimonas sp.]